jgi:hypothetical protein
MWPFDKLLTNRISDLEKQVELITGQNQILTSQLEMAQAERVDLLNKIFAITGVIKFNRPISEDESVKREPIPISKRSVGWPQMKQNLEVQARAEYWEKKAKEKEAKQVTVNEQLEKDVLGDTKNG